MSSDTPSQAYAASSGLRPRVRLDWDGFISAVVRRFTWRWIITCVVILSVSYIFLAYGMLPPLTAQAPAEIYWSRAVVWGLIAVSIMLAVPVADEAVERGVGRVRAYLFALIIAAALSAGGQYAVRTALGLRTVTTEQRWEVRYTQPLTLFLHLLLICGPAIFASVSIRSSLEATRRTQAAELARAQAARRTYESHLQAMQARVEPRFLFNTLVQVRALYGRDALLGGRVLDDLNTYLRAALPHIRDSSSVLGKEIELAQAYLSITTERLGTALSFAFDVQDDARNARIPAMILLPLIDLSLHGRSEACGEPGTLTVVAEAVAERLKLSVEDTWGGFAGADDDTGTASIGDRIRALYGEAGSFVVETLNGGGSRAALDIPASMVP